MSFCSQYVHLLSIVLKLKCWRLPFIIVVLVAAASQLYLFKPIQSIRVQTGTSDLDIVGQKEFMESNSVLGQWENEEMKTFTAILTDAAVRMSGDKNSKGIPMITCVDEDDCQMKYFKQLLGKEPGKVSHYINFNPSKNQKTTLQCQMASGAELYCPFIYYLTAISTPLDERAYFQYKTVHTFRVKSSFSWLPANTSRGGSDTVCARDVTYPFVIQFTLMVQMVFVAAALVFYLLIGTVAWMYELKQKGLLKLAFHRRLSVWAYWLAIWTIALLEMLVIAIVHTAAHYFQCPGFHPPLRLILVFLCTFVQLCCATAWILLITVLIRSIFIASLAACLLHLVVMVCIAVNRFAFSSENRYRWMRNLMFAIPFSHIAEQISTVLLQGDIPMDTFYEIVLPASAALLVLLVVATIYLDSVTKAGNGRRYPIYYIFTKRFWSMEKKDLVVIKEPEPSVMVEDVPRNMKLKLCTYGLKKRSSAASLGLRKFSAIFYQDQITAVVGHNGSGKSILLQILSGDRLASRGQATINKILITDPLYRNHLSNDIGYCPQIDALVDDLTVLDILVLIATSSGLEWENVQHDVISVLSALQIEDKLNAKISSLSSSEKRKVCVTMALVGKPKVILLDFPSRDLDYVSRRRLWRLLHEYKNGRAVIVSTLFIDEAEGMADRMIFMSGGRVICAGSSFFLRRAFDCRFIIQIASKTEFHVFYMSSRLTAKFPTIRVHSYGNTDLELEVSVLDYDILPSLIQEIESMNQIMDEFRIKHHSLDEVYTKLQYLKPSDVEEHFQSSTIGYIADDVDKIREKETALELSDTVPDGPVVVKLMPGRMTTLIGMFIVHFLQIKRSLLRLLIRLVLPVFLLLLLIGGAILEKSMNNEKLTVKYDLQKVDKLDTESGVCFSYIRNPKVNVSSLSIKGIPDTDCSKYLFSIDSPQPNIQNIKVPVERVEQTKNFTRIITDSEYFSRVNMHCGPSKSPCPVIYSSDWNVVNHVITNHDVYIGAYVTPLTGSPMDTVTSLLHTFTNTLRQTTEVYITEAKAIVTDRTTLLKKLGSIKVEGITDMRSIFYPFYGMFVQLVLLAVLPSICLIDIIQDRSSGVFGQLLTMSMSRLHYWLCTLLSHWIQLALLYGVSTLILMMLIQPGYMNKFFAGGVFAPTLILGLTNGLLCVYIIGSLCSGNGYLVVAGHLFFSLIVSMSALIVQQNDVLGQCMIYLLPHYAIIAPTFYGTRFAHYSLSFLYYAKRKTEINLLDYMFNVPHMRDALIALIIHFILLMALLIILENRQALCKCLYKTQNSKTETFSYEFCKDKCVVKEVKRIESNPKSEEHIMEANQLQAISSEGKIALKNLTFGVKHGEIFGLIGPCYSGKSSAVRVIVGDQRPCGGKVDFHVDDNWASNDVAKGQAFIGYCPKNNPLVERLTVSENLFYYSRFIGAPTDRIEEVLKQFFLEKDANTVVMHATVGVKRRLTLAISVLHTPRFVAINQASAGVDPEGRQLMWQAIKSLAGKRRGMLVATQQMEEAESLCGRVCIMTTGLMASLSNVEELFDKYKRSYFLEIQIGDSSNLTPDGMELAKAEIIDIVLRKFKEAVIIEQLTLRLQFGIPDQSIQRLSKALSWLVEKMKTLKFLYFSLHHATTDQIMRIIVVDNENKAANGTSDLTALATV